MPNENDALHGKFLVLMAAAPMRDYSDDPVVYCRVGEFLAEQAEKRARP